MPSSWLISKAVQRNASLRNLLTIHAAMLQDLMRKMQQDQAKLQGKLAGSVAADVVLEAHLATVADGVQVGIEGSITKIFS